MSLAAEFQSKRPSHLDIGAGRGIWGADGSQRVFNFSAHTAARRIRAAAHTAGIDPANITASSPALGMALDLAAYRAEMLDLMQPSR